MFKVKLTILLINLLVASTICDDNINKPIDKQNNEDKKECTEPNDIPDYITAQLNVADYLGMCFNNIVNMTAFKSAIDDAAAEENVKEIVKNACLKKDLIHECLEKDYLGPIDECTTVEVRELRDSLLLQSRNLLGHLCFDDGLRVRNFLNLNSINCFVEKRDSLDNCTSPLSDMLTSNETVAEKCNDIKIVQTCYVETLQTCERQDAAIFADELLHLIFDEHICKNIGDSNKEIDVTDEIVEDKTDNNDI